MPESRRNIYMNIRTGTWSLENCIKRKIKPEILGIKFEFDWKKYTGTYVRKIRLG